MFSTLFPSLSTEKVVLHSGYPEHAIKGPLLLSLITIGLPHFGQTSLVALG